MSIPKEPTRLYEWHTMKDALPQDNDPRLVLLFSSPVFGMPVLSDWSRGGIPVHTATYDHWMLIRRPD